MLKTNKNDGFYTQNDGSFTKNDGFCTKTDEFCKILVLNKLDRLIVELQLTVEEANEHITRVLENVNAVIGSMFAEDLMESRASAIFSADDGDEDGEDEAEDRVADDEDGNFSIIPEFSTEIVEFSPDFLDFSIQKSGTVWKTGGEKADDRDAGAIFH